MASKLLNCLGPEHAFVYDVGMKRCKKCGERKSLDEFYRSPGMRDGYRSDCKSCNLAAKAARYRANPGPDIERARRWQKENPERYRLNQRRMRSSPEGRRRQRASHLLRKFGMTLGQYEEMCEAQEGGCAICRRPPRTDTSLHIDHEHKTGQIRGLLCFSCNAALGYFGDDGDRLVAAAAYLGPAPTDPALLKRLADLKQQAALLS